MPRPLAALFALLFLTQSIVALVGLRPANGAMGAEAGFALSSNDRPCADNDLNGNAGHESCSHAACCIFCPAAFAFGGLSATWALAPFAALEAISDVLARVPEVPISAPSGWATSWSSQAPPLFS
ncbi:Hypothetical protein BN69_2463 [Methylocystis sp. SC2]|nr:Hypothetical protein BN69_2463 [Methylocystis sp. SC2]